MTKDTQLMVKSADRVIDVLELLAKAKRELSHGEIVELLDIPKSSLTQLLRNLVSRRYLELSANGRCYRLGTALLDLSRQASQVRDLSKLITPYLEKITQTCGESSAFNEMRGDCVVVVATLIGRHRLVTHMRLGDQAPLYATSGGKAILAFLPEPQLKAYLKRTEFEPVTPRTLRSEAELVPQLQAVRSCGFAYSHEEFTTGIVGIATPILDGDNLPLASLNVAVPIVRYDEPMRALVEGALRSATRDLRRQVLAIEDMVPAGA